MNWKAMMVAGMFAGAQVMFAQEAGSKTIVNDVIEHWQTSKSLSMAVADAMPEDQYKFKATPAEMTFGQQMNHLAAGLMGQCSNASGTKAPMEKPADDSKKAAMRVVDVAYYYCISGLQAMDDKKLLTPVNVNGHQYTPFSIFWNGFTHAAHHRGQAEVYLRLKGVTPPAYKF